MDLASRDLKYSGRIMTRENRAGLRKCVKTMDINREFTQLGCCYRSGADQERGSPAVLYSPVWQMDSCWSQGRPRARQGENQPHKSSH